MALLLEDKAMEQTRIKRADSNEPATIVDKLLLTGWERKPMYSGDYFFHTVDFKKVGITRKTVEDLLGSIGNKPNPEKPGRKEKSFGQHLEEMADYYNIKIILLEGSWRKVSPEQYIVSRRGIEYYTWDMAWNFLRTWQDRGYSVELTINEGHTIQRLNALYAYYMKPSHTGGLNKYSIVGDSRLLALRCGGVGIKYGQALLDHFGSLQNIANANFNDLLKLDGIGDKRAENIVMHFRRGSKVQEELKSERLKHGTGEQVSR